MMDWGIRLSERQKDLFCTVGIIGILLIRFFKPIFLAQSISKFFLTAHWDSLFYSLKNGESFGMDPSLVLLSIPYRFLVAEYWHHGLPLWNQWSGFGMPLIGDPQVFLFSPLFVIFTLFPSIHSWDIILVIQLAVAALSTYFLCKELELNFVGALIAALLFIFNPWLQWQLELVGMGTCLVPFVFLFFCRMAKEGSFKNIALAGIVAAIDVLSAHPEISFITIFFACIFTCLITYYSERSKRQTLLILRSSLLHLLLAGLIALGLSAPMFIPFLEYARHAESYKLDTIASAGLSWQAIFANYLFPFQPKASLYFGALSLSGVLASFCFSRNKMRFAQPLMICLVLSLLGVTRIFPFEFFFRIPPLSMTYATYWLPEYFVLISILSGMGCSYLIEECLTDTFSLKSKQTQIFILSNLLLLAIPLLYFPWHNNNIILQFDNTFGPTQFNLKIWIFNTLSALIALCALIFSINKSKRWKTFASLIFLGLGFSTLAIASSKSLGIRPSFEYPKTLPFSSTISNTDRFLTVGNHLLRPNTNQFYRLPFLQVLNPIFPRGFIGFIKACGAETDQYTQTFSPIISPLLKLAGVNKIISETPILDATITEAIGTTKTISFNDSSVPKITYANLLSLSDIHLLHDSKTNSFFFYAKVTPLPESTDNYHVALAIEDLRGNTVTGIDPQFVSLSSGPKNVLCSGFIPKELKHWKVLIRILQDKDCTFIHPTQASFGKLRGDNSWLLSTSNEKQKITEINNDRFKLIAQYNSILEYEDKEAFNRYFFVGKTLWVKDKQEALTYLTHHTNELQNIAVLEDKQKDQFENVIHSMEPNKSINGNSSIIFDQASTVKRLDSYDENSTFKSSTDFSLKVSAKKPSLLIASDIYYPGWKVYIDDQESAIFCADYLFRAVIIPAGAHIVRFVYQPISVMIGLLLFCITSITLMLLALRKRFVLSPNLRKSTVNQMVESKIS